MTWHILGEQLADYLDGRTDATTAASVEAHLIGCAICRDRLARRTPAETLSASWAGLVGRVDAGHAGATTRVLRRVGVGEHHLRLLAPTTSLRIAWLGATALALGVGALLVRDTPEGASLGLLIYLTLAAIAPLAAVAAALSAASEPAPEVAIATPTDPVQLLGLRAGAVLVVTDAIALAAGVLLPGPWTEAAMWLLPSMAMCAITTAMSGRYGPLRAGAVIGVVWVCGVGSWVAATHDLFAPFRTGPQLAYLTLAAAAVAVLTLRPDLMDPSRSAFARRTPRSTS